MGDQRSYNLSRRHYLRALGVTSVLGAGVNSVETAAAAGGDEIWAFETGGEVGSPTVMDGTVYVGSNDTDLHAINASSGRQEWAFDADTAIPYAPNVSEGTVYFGSDESLYAVDIAARTQEWEFGDGGFNSPTMTDSTVFAGSLNSLHAVNATSGTQDWVFETEDTVYSPTVVDGTVYVGSADNNLYAINTADGSQEWVFETGDWIYTSPTVANGTVYVGSWDENLYAIDASTGEQVWAFNLDSFGTTTPTVYDGTVFMHSLESLHAVDAATGSEEWVFDANSIIDSSPTIAGGQVYFGAQDDFLYAIDVESGDQEWRFATDDMVISSPTVVDSTVYVGSDDNNLYAVDAGVSGSSEGSRVMLATLGHHDGWADTATTVTQNTDDLTAVVDSFENGNIPDRWAITEQGEGGSVEITADRGYHGSRSMRIHVGGDVTVESDLSEYTFEDGDELFSWIYTEESGAKVTLRVGSRSIRLSPFGNINYDTAEAEKTELSSDSGTGRWIRLGIRLFPSTDEVIFRFRDDSGVDIESDRIATNSEYDAFEIRGGDYYPNYDFYIDNVTAGPYRDDATQPTQNADPTATFENSPPDPETGEDITFDASASSDDSGIRSYEWDLDGDDSFETTGETATTSFDSEGDYTITLRVTDDDGVTETAQQTIDVTQSEFQQLKDAHLETAETVDEATLSSMGVASEAESANDAYTTAVENNNIDESTASDAIRRLNAGCSITLTVAEEIGSQPELGGTNEVDLTQSMALPTVQTALELATGALTMSSTASSGSSGTFSQTLASTARDQAQAGINSLVKYTLGQSSDIEGTIEIEGSEIAEDLLNNTFGTAADVNTAIQEAKEVIAETAATQLQTYIEQGNGLGTTEIPQLTGTVFEDSPITLDGGVTLMYELLSADTVSTDGLAGSTDTATSAGTSTENNIRDQASTSESTIADFAELSEDTGLAEALINLAEDPSAYTAINGVAAILFSIIGSIPDALATGAGIGGLLEINARHHLGLYSVIQGEQYDAF